MSKEENKNETENDEVDSTEVRDDLSKVARNPKQNIAIMVVACLICGFIIFNMFFSGPNDKDIKKTIELPKNIIKPDKEHIEKDISIVKLPDLPLLDPLPLPSKIPVPTNIDSKLPNPPQSLPNPVQSLPTFDTQSISNRMNDGSDKQKQRLQQKNTSPIVILGSSTPSSKVDPTNDISSFSAKITNMSDKSDFLIASGKIIDAVLETAINSDSGAPQVR